MTRAATGRRTARGTPRAAQQIGWSEQGYGQAMQDVAGSEDVRHAATRWRLSER
jgi:hypothetical protein